MMSRAAMSGRYSPLRYPGGKGKLARFVATVIRNNQLSDGVYAEPYCGGAAVAWELLSIGLVREVWINDYDPHVFAFWKAVLKDTDLLLRFIRDTSVTVENRDRLREHLRQNPFDAQTETGFAFFFLNRTHRSGIINASVIGGRSQSGDWKIDARFNKDDLSYRIEKIARMRGRVRVSNDDAAKFILRISEDIHGKHLIYFDPPYVKKGHQLYRNSYREKDHREIGRLIRESGLRNWIVSYDDHETVREIYSGEQMISYNIGYSVRNAGRGEEVMFFSKSLAVPQMVGSCTEVERQTAA